MIWTILILLALVASVFGYRYYLFLTLTSGEKILATPDFVGGKFINSVPNKKYTIKEIVGMVFKSGQKDPKTSKPLPMENLDKTTFQNPPMENLQFIWHGHSSVLLECEGKRFLFDPVFAQEAGPLFLGPKRFHPVPLVVENLPDLDAVFISHDLYNHLDKNVILYLANKALSFFVPLGVGKRLQNWGVDKSKILEFDWWDSVRIGDIKIASTPARHYSSRNLLDKEAIENNPLFG